jgi:hypothetical protein
MSPSSLSFIKSLSYKEQVRINKSFIKSLSYKELASSLLQ